jgi:hypothetical protein
MKEVISYGLAELPRYVSLENSTEILLTQGL